MNDSSPNNRVFPNGNHKLPNHDTNREPPAAEEKNTQDSRASCKNPKRPNETCSFRPSLELRQRLEAEALVLNTTVAGFLQKLVQDYFSGDRITLEDRRLALIIGYLAGEPNEEEIFSLIRSFVYKENE